MGVVSTIDIKNKRNNRGVIMKNKALGFLSLLISFLLVFSILSPVSVFAALDKQIMFSDSNITPTNLLGQLGDKNTDYVSGNVTFKTNGELIVTDKGTPITLLKLDSGKIMVDATAFKNNSKNDDVTKAMKIFVDALSKVDANPDTVQQIMADIQEICIKHTKLQVLS